MALRASVCLTLDQRCNAGPTSTINHIKRGRNIFFLFHLNQPPLPWALSYCEISVPPNYNTSYI